MREREKREGEEGGRGGRSEHVHAFQQTRSTERGTSTGMHITSFLNASSPSSFVVERS